MSEFKFDKWPTEFKVITQFFGVNPQNYSQFGLPGHEGIDIRAPGGSKVFCVAPGKVYQVHRDRENHNYGIHVRVAHEGGYKTTYAHLQEALVNEGEQVDAGTILGLADSTGNSFGSHLHLTLKKEGAKYLNYPSNIIDPTPFLLPLLGWRNPTGPFVGGWVMTTGILRIGSLAQANPDGTTLYIAPSFSVQIPNGSIIIVAGNSRQGFTPVQVPKATLGMDDFDLPLNPVPEPLPTVMTVDGWSWKEFLHIIDNQAIINTRYGINIRQEPDSESRNIGVVGPLKTVYILGGVQNGYLPVRVRQADFVGKVNILERPLDKPIQSLSDLPEGFLLGWIRSYYLQFDGPFATVRNLGTQLLNKPHKSADHVAIVKGNATITIAGQELNNHTPVLVHKDQIINIIANQPEIQIPDQLPDNQPPILPPAQAINGTTPGWVFTSSIHIDRNSGKSDEGGLNLRDKPRRDGELIGFIPAEEEFLVMGQPWGEFTPVRVDKDKLQPPVEENDLDPDPGPLGKARIGLHASADPMISEAEHDEFRLLRPGIIKVLSLHSGKDINRLASNHPNASWIVRAFLDFGNRDIKPNQFFDYTINDITRSLKELQGKDVVVELHNEPNLAVEGLWSSWKNGADFAQWWIELVGQYRRALPGVQFIFPGLSPGPSVANIKIDHIEFVEACRKAVRAADGLGVHLYWSNIYPMSKSLAVLDDYINRFRGKLIWITEASNNKDGTSPTQKARQYLDFWHALQQRPSVRGVTYFVASASNPTFKQEVWVGRGIGKLVGKR